MLLKIQPSPARQMYPQTQCPIMIQSFGTLDLVSWVKEVRMNFLSKVYLMVKSLGTLGFCEQCVYGKHKRVSFKPAIHNTKGNLDYIHSDLWGPSRKLSLSGCIYLLTFIDDFSRKVWCYFIKQKNEVFDVFLE